MCRLIVVLCTLILLINFSYYNSKDLQTSQPQLQSQFQIENYTLPDSFGFYKGSKDMSEIEKIVFTQCAPQTYDESWNADELNAGCIKGYLCENTVYIVGEHIFANSSCSYMFAGENSYGDHLWFNLKKIEGLELLDTSQAQNMKYMFAFSKMEEIHGISNWNVSNVKNFAAMFQGHDNSGDIQIKNLEISEWDTSSAENMSHMFYGCGQMEYISVDNWNVSNVKNFSHMFADCYQLKELNLIKWQTESAENFDAFLNDCHSLVSIDVSNLNTSKCTQFSQMFESCVNLQFIIGINNWDVSKASYCAFSETFHNCYSLKSLKLSNWLATPDNTARMFKNCYNLSYLDISGLDLSKIETSIEMYDNCNNLIFLKN